MDIYKARLAAGDENAIDTSNVIRRAGVKIVGVLNSLTQEAKPGETTCINKITALVKKRGVMKARMVMEALVKAGRAPIGPAEIDAVDMFFHDLTLLQNFDEAVAAIKAVGTEGVLQSRLIGTRDRRPQKAVLLEMYQKKQQQLKAA